VRTIDLPFMLTNGFQSGASFNVVAAHCATLLAGCFGKLAAYICRLDSATSPQLRFEYVDVLRHYAQSHCDISLGVQALFG
jgi:hypothetical protein